jgi:hypothetical protein
MENNMLRKALWIFLKPLIQLITNILNPEVGEEWLTELKKFLRKEACWVRTMLQRLIDSGKYDWIHHRITDKTFPIPENPVFGHYPKVYHFNRDISSEDVIKEMDKEGYRPAMTWDLLDYGAKNPKEQRNYPIVGLGSVAESEDGRALLCLSRCLAGRSLDVFWSAGNWTARYRFLAVRKKKVTKPSVS